MEKKLLIRWSDERYSVGVEEIDKQHQKLIDLINTLYNAFREGKARDTLQPIIEEMANYTKYHFDTEERYFKLFNYEQSAEHIKEHRDFEKKVEAFQNDLKKNKASVTYDVMNFLRSWLSEHIQGSDKQYTTTFRANGLE